MNKILSMCMILGAAVLFTACAGEEDDLFDKSAAERLNEMRDVYSARLEAQPAGWAMQYYPTDEEDGYLILADFNADHSVLVAMRNAYTNYKYAECKSVWDVITDNGPVLSFNTYNDLFHIFSDPSDYWGGDTGTGIGGDYEFVVVDAPEDASYMMLKGKKRGTYTLLTPLEQGTDFETYFEDVYNFQDTYFSMYTPSYLYLKRVETEATTEKTFHLEFETTSRVMIYPDGTDAITDGVVYPFVLTKRAGKYYLRFRDQISVGDGLTVREFVYDETQDKFISVEDESSVICADVPSQFLANTWDEGHTWVVKKADENSAKYTDLVSKASSAMSSINKRYSVKNVNMTKLSDGVSQMSFQYGDAKQVAKFLFNYQITEGQLNYQYQQAADDASEKIRTRDAAIENLVKAFNGTFQVDRAITAFDFSRIKLTSATDSELWFYINY